MRKALELAGQHSGRLLIIERAGSGPTGVIWKCLCDPAKGGCGNTTYKPAGLLACGDVKSCGCLRSETNRMRTGRFRKGRGALTITERFSVQEALQEMTGAD